jgi:hypothetical protein
MTILSLNRPQEVDLLTFENHPGYPPDAVNPVVASAEFVLKVSTKAMQRARVY